MIFVGTDLVLERSDADRATGTLILILKGLAAQSEDRSLKKALRAAASQLRKTLPDTDIVKKMRLWG
jgi:hypothetical protein